MKPAQKLAVAACDDSTDENVQLLRPQLPSAECILPYLRRIDSNRIYTNNGPLSTEFECRLAAELALPQVGFAAANSGTAALIGAILATAGPAAEERPFALMPAYTFVATAVAAERCGYRVSLADIDDKSWMLDPERLADHPALTKTGVVIPVAPFGRPIPQAPWLTFHERTGIPVVIDGAASFDRIAESPERHNGAIPVALSFHATKAFGTGEGGGVASTDTNLLRLVAQALNFGFYGRRDSETPSINGKMSEYHAAVGLAELDAWQEKRSALRAVNASYRRQLERVGLAHRFSGAPDISLGYALFQCGDENEADRVRDGLQERGIETRLWYGKGLHRQSYLATLPLHTSLTATDDVAPRVLGLPLAPDLSEQKIARVASALAEVTIPVTPALPRQ
ncbi:MAG: DegT/DnrJ/EryC1/StrS family aminotransferase [Rhodomicrobium sp.]